MLLNKKFQIFFLVVASFASITLLRGASTSNALSPSSISFSPPGGYQLPPGDSNMYPMQVTFKGWTGDTMTALNNLRSQLNSIISGRAFDRTTTSIRVVFFNPDGSLHNIYAKNAALNVLPASTEKMFTSSSTLWALGSKYSFRTKVDLGPRATQTGGIINGDVILRPSGDPTFRSADLDMLADQLRTQGITQINGNVISDLSGEDALTPEAKKYFAAHETQPLQTTDTSFDGSMAVSDNGVQGKDTPARLPSEVAPKGKKQPAVAVDASNNSTDESGDATDEDASDPGALSAYPNFSIDRNVVSVTVSAGSSKGSGVSVRISPPIQQIVVANHGGTSAPATRIRKRVRVHRRWRTVVVGSRSVNTLRVSSSGTPTDPTQVITVSGLLPARSARTYTFAIKNVPLAMAAILKYKLGQHGVQITGQAKSDKVLQTGTPKTLAAKDSRLIDLLRQMNKRSDNYLAESMFRKLSTIASVAANAPSDRARKLMRSFLQVCNTEGTYCTFIDGSGLSHDNRVTANTVIDLLKGIKDQGMFDIFTSTLSIAGYDGTLRHRMIGTPAQYNAHGKTGTLSNVTALAGYVVTADGQLASYFITMQNFSGGIWTYKAAQNSIVQTLAGFKYANYLPPPGSGGSPTPPQAAH